MVLSKFADQIFYNGKIYTADQNNHFCEAIAIKQGRILDTGSFSNLQQYQNSSTQLHDLEGKTVIPGLIDAHLHPFWGAQQLDSCHLNYASHTIAQILTHIQRYLDNDLEQNDWLMVYGWYRQGVLPAGVDITRSDLDKLITNRPVMLFSTDCHTIVVNSCGLNQLKIDENTSNPTDGQIRRDHNGMLNGILEDGIAMRCYESALKLSENEIYTIAKKMQYVLNQQGVTTVMDARVNLNTFNMLQQMSNNGELSLRILGAFEITPKQAENHIRYNSLNNIQKISNEFNKQIWQATPCLAIKHIKMFIDGVLEAPLMTAALLEPYTVNQGSEDAPNWQKSNHFGDYYFSPQVLNELMPKIAEIGFHPHLHTVGDGAIEVSLNAVSLMRQKYPELDIRPSFAHNELVAPHQYQRFAELGVIPLVSYQWANFSNTDRLKEINMLGEKRFREREPAGKFIDAGVSIAFGSDWPIDSLDEWYAFQVGMTRQGLNDEGCYNERLDNDRNLTLIEVLRSATINAATMLAIESEVGSLEVGKLADFAVLNQNIFETSPSEISQTTVNMTVVGGKVVYTSDQ